MIHLNEENSDLKHKYFPLGDGIRKHLKNTLKNYSGDKNVDGYKRLNNLLSAKPGVSYAEMKRIKNFFDNYAGTNKSVEYTLNGGEPMMLWVNNTLNNATSTIENYKQAKKDAGMSNAFRKPHEKNRQLKVSKLKVERVSENKTHTIILTEAQAQMIFNALSF